MISPVELQKSFPMTEHFKTDISLADSTMYIHECNVETYFKSPYLSDWSLTSLKPFPCIQKLFCYLWALTNCSSDTGGKDCVVVVYWLRKYDWSWCQHLKNIRDIPINQHPLHRKHIMSGLKSQILSVINSLKHNQKWVKGRRLFKQEEHIPYGMWKFITE